MFQKPNNPVSPPREGMVYLCRDGEIVPETLAFGFEPVGDETRPQLNIRSEDRHFPIEWRCLVPADHFFIPARYRPAERRGRFTTPGRLFCFAAMWRMPSRYWPASYATLTLDAGPDAAPFGERQMAVLFEEDWGHWLAGAKPEHLLLVPPPAGTFAVDQVGRPAPAIADLFG